MALKPSKHEKFRQDLGVLDQVVPENLQLPSLSQSRMEGFAAYFVIILPLLNSVGKPVFTDLILEELFLLLDRRFGGCLVPSGRSHPPYWGLWHPPGSQASEGEKDYVTTIQVFANPIEPTNQFFTRLKQILRTAGHIQQEEILISRFDCWLM